MHVSVSVHITAIRLTLLRVAVSFSTCKFKQKSIAIIKKRKKIKLTKSEKPGGLLMNNDVATNEHKNSRYIDGDAPRQVRHTANSSKLTNKRRFYEDFP